MNFDEEINRNGTYSLKYDCNKRRNKPEDVFPLWVADMDFKCPDDVLKDLHKKVDFGIFGYSEPDEEYFESLYNWYHNNFQIDLNTDWVVMTPGIVFALAMAVKAFTKESDYILINNPVYYPFSEVILDNNRNVISSDLILKNSHYEIDFEDFENKIKKYNVKLYLLCSPHNPVGRVWTKTELDKIIDICKKNNVIIVSDEIHSDFVWEGKHTCLLNYQEYLNNIIVATSPTKTFNFATLQISNILIPNNDLRLRFKKEIDKSGYSQLNLMGIVACNSAYKYGLQWLNELRDYLKENINFVDTFLKEKLPKIKLIKPEGTYLLWLDFKDLKLSNEELESLILNKAKLWLDSGSMFGKSGEGFQRINIALPRKKLKWALEQLEKTFNNIET